MGPLSGYTVIPARQGSHSKGNTSLSGLEIAATQEVPDAAPDRAEHLFHLRVARRKGGLERERPCRRPDEHTVEGECVKVHVPVESELSLKVVDERERRRT